MKRNLFNILAVLGLLLSTFAIDQQAFAQSARDEIEAASRVPLMVSYQGNVTVDGTPFTGSGKFKFAIVNSTGTASYWSNDGTSAAGSEPIASVPVPVTNGLFSVMLGERMTVLSADVFSSSSRSLRIWFSSDGGASFTQLAPDRDIASVPFALVAEKAGDANTLDGLDSAALQRRVSGTCAPGATVISVNADGSVNCRSVSPLPGFTSSTLDTANNIGQYTSIITGSDGLALISYYDTTSDNLEVAHCSDLECSTATLTPLDTTGNVGQYTSIAIGADGLGLISYYDVTNTALKVAHCSNTNCSAATITPIDNTASVGKYSSIAIGTDGLGVISYFDETNGDLKIAHCNDLTCTAATLTSISGGSFDWGFSTSITIGVNGFPVIAHISEDDQIFATNCTNLTCSERGTLGTTHNADRYSGTSIIKNVDGRPIISYKSNEGLSILFCQYNACESLGVPHTLDENVNAGQYSSIRIGSDGMPIISYYSADSQDLKIVHCSLGYCSYVTNITILDSDNSVGAMTGLTIGPDGYPLVSYYDETNGSLKVAHCNNHFCTPYMMDK